MRKKDLLNANYDYYIVGSDQVWNNQILDFDTSYFLDFTNKPKYSYAASLGSLVSSPENYREYSELLKEFSRISVREKSAVDTIRTISGHPVSVVCDPVFLLSVDEWRKIAHKYDAGVEEYVLCYFPGGASNNLKKHSNEIAKKYNCKRLIITEDWHDLLLHKDIMGYDVGPQEFIYLIDHAKCVCTDSFHGTAFSLLFGKKLIHDDIITDERILTIENEIRRYSGLAGLEQYVYSGKQFLQNVMQKEVEEK